MKILIFGDVHGNLPALEKLFIIEKNNYDIFICHGDLLNYGPWGNECIEYLTEYNNSVLLIGNHERYFLTGTYIGNHPVAKAFFLHCYPKFDKSLTAEINQFKTSISIEDYKVQHTLWDMYIYKDTDISNFVLNSNYIIGHSHHQYHISSSGFNIYNTGSLGQNRKYINQSCYLIFDTITKKIDLKNFIYDVDIVINQMKLEKYPSICIDYYLSKSRLL